MLCFFYFLDACSQKIQLYLKGSQMAPQVRWIYRNQDNDILNTTDFQSDVYNGIHRYETNEPITDDDIFQQAIAMDMTWNASLLAEIPPDGLPVAQEVGNQNSAYDGHSCEEPRFPFQIDKRFNFKVAEDQPPNQQMIDNFTTSFQPITNPQQPHDQQPIEMSYLDQLSSLEQNVSFDQLAFDFVFNQPKLLPYQDKTNTPPGDALNTPQQDYPISEESLPMYLLHSVFPPSPVQPEHAQQVNASISSNYHEKNTALATEFQDIPLTLSDDDSQDTPVDEIDDVILSPLSPFMSDDMYYFAMRESEGLSDLL